MDSIFKYCCSLIVAFMFCFAASGYAQDEAPVAPPQEEQAVPKEEPVVPAEQATEPKCKEDCDEGMVFDKDLQKCIVKEEPKSE